jgi:hypothetical protein
VEDDIFIFYTVRKNAGRTDNAEFMNSLALSHCSMCLDALDPGSEKAPSTEQFPGTKGRGSSIPPVLARPMLSYTDRK